MVFRILGTVTHKKTRNPPYVYQMVFRIVGMVTHKTPGIPPMFIKT